MNAQPSTRAGCEALDTAVAEDLYLEMRWLSLVGQIASFQFDSVVATTATPDGHVEVHTTFFGYLREIANGKLAIESRDPGSKRKGTERVLYVPTERLVAALVVPPAHHGLSLVPSDPDAPLAFVLSPFAQRTHERTRMNAPDPSPPTPVSDAFAAAPPKPAPPAPHDGPWKHLLGQPRMYLFKRPVLCPQLPGANQVTETLIAVAVDVVDGVLFLACPKQIDVPGQGTFAFQVEVRLEDVACTMASALVGKPSGLIV